MLLYALAKNISDLTEIGELRSECREVLGTDGTLGLVKAMWPHYDLISADEMQLLTYQRWTADMPWLYDIPDHDVVAFFKEHATAAQIACPQWQEVVVSAGAPVLAVASGGKYCDAAFAGDLDVADMLVIMHCTLHAGPRVKEGEKRAMSVVVKTLLPRERDRKPEQLGPLDCLEDLGAAGTARACAALHAMLKDDGLARRIRTWEPQLRARLAGEGAPVSDAEVARLAAAAGKKHKRQWG